MRLAELIASYPSARLANPDDNARILEFFERTAMHTSAFDVQYRRRPDFFKLLHYQSDRAFVIIGDDAHGRVHALGSLSLRPGWMNGKATTIGYWGDLRIAADRGASRSWRRLFAELLIRTAEIDELADCEYWYTAIIDSNAAARNALRPRPNQPILVPVGPFTMRNLMMRMPWSSRARTDRPWHIRQARNDDNAELLAFFERENQQSAFGFRGEFARRLSCWDGLSLTDFICVSDEHGMLACMAPWSPSMAKQTLLPRLPAGLRLLGKLASVIPTTPVRVPAAGEFLRAPQLTHLTFASRLSCQARSEVFRDMLHHLLDSNRHRDWHCISFCDFNTWDLGQSLRGFMQKTLPITVYAILPPERAHEVDNVQASGPPAFEMAMV